MKRYVVKGAAFIGVGAVTFAVLVILAITNIWDVSKIGSFVFPLVTGLAAAFSVGKNKAGRNANTTQSPKSTQNILIGCAAQLARTTACGR